MYLNRRKSMNTKNQFDYFCADYSGTKNYIYNCSVDHDCHDTCLKWVIFTLYGIPIGLTDSDYDAIHSGKYEKAVNIGQIYGCLILCRRIIEEGYDPEEICDDVDGDLQYTISALKDKGGPLDEEDGDPYQDVFYIHKFSMKKGYNNVKIRSSIIQELPYIILSLLNVFPNILAFYSAPIKYTPDPQKEKKRAILCEIVRQKMDAQPIQQESKKNNGVLSFGSAYKLSDDEINMIMGKRSSNTPGYPEEDKNKKEFKFYESNGFTEIANSRLLYKRTDQ